MVQDRERFRQNFGPQGYIQSHLALLQKFVFPPHEFLRKAQKSIYLSARKSDFNENFGPQGIRSHLALSRKPFPSFPAFLQAD